MKWVVYKYTWSSKCQVYLPSAAAERLAKEFKDKADLEYVRLSDNPENLKTA